MTLQKQGSEGAVLFVKRVEAKQISSLFITYNKTSFAKKNFRMRKSHNNISSTHEASKYNNTTFFYTLLLTFLF
jgi:hypothetical protein